MAEALGKHLAAEVFESYSGGTETKAQINQDALRLIKIRYGIDMAVNQYSKLLSELPEIDIVIKMGCNVLCPFLPSQHEEDWGLEDPTGQPDEVFQGIIDQIESKIKGLALRIQRGDLKLEQRL